MKHKRMAALFVLVTFAGSPPVWHKLGSFISSVQHKAQIKFLSMVLDRGTDEGDVTDTSATPQGELVASSATSELTHASASETTPPLSNSRKVRFGRAAKSDGLQDIALKHAAKVSKLELSPRLYTFLPQSPNASNVPAVAAISREWVISEKDLRELPSLPQHDSTAPAPDEKTNSDIRLKLKKYFEEHKNVRQRNRFVFGKPNPAPSSAPSTDVTTDGEG